MKIFMMLLLLYCAVSHGNELTVVAPSWEYQCHTILRYKITTDAEYRLDRNILGKVHRAVSGGDLKTALSEVRSHRSSEWNPFLLQIERTVLLSMKKSEFHGQAYHLGEDFDLKARSDLDTALIEAMAAYYHPRLGPKRDVKSRVLDILDAWSSVKISDHVAAGMLGSLLWYNNMSDRRHIGYGRLMSLRDAYPAYSERINPLIELIEREIKKEQEDVGIRIKAHAQEVRGRIEHCANIFSPVN